jgi:hypothetical protein
MNADTTIDIPLVIIAAVVVALAVGIWFQARNRLRARGGGWLPQAVVAVAIAAVLLVLGDSRIPFEASLPVLIIALIAIYQPDLVVRYTGGPRREWSLLRDTHALDRERSTIGVEALAARLDALEAYRTPRTAAYLDAYRADPDDPRVAELAAGLRATFGARPLWDRAGPTTATGEDDRPAAG